MSLSDILGGLSVYLLNPDSAFFHIPYCDVVIYNITPGTNITLHVNKVELK